jgi:hypothetical protein
MSSILLWIAALTFALLAAAPAEAVTSIPTAAGPVWDICDSTGGCGAFDDTGAILTGGGGGGDPAFATFGQMEVFVSSDISCCTTVSPAGLGLTFDGDRSWTTTTPFEDAQVRVSRTIFAPAGTSYLRYLDTITNLQDTEAFLQIRVFGLHAAGADGVLQTRVGTPGEPVPAGNDFVATWGVLRDTAPPLANTVGFVTSGAPNRSGSATSFFADSGGILQINAVASVPAGGSVTFAIFVVLGPPAASATTLAETAGLAGGPDFADLTVAEKVALANWGVPQRIATGPAGNGGPHVRVWDVDPATGAASEFTGFFAFDPAFTGGVTLAARGRALLVGAGPGAAPEVRVFQQDDETGAIGPVAGFLSAVVYAPAFAGGVFVACQTYDIRCDDDLVVGAGAGGEAHVRVLGGDGILDERIGFIAYDGGFRGGVRVASGDFDRDGDDEVVVGPGPGGGSHIRVLQFASNGRTVRPLVEFLAFDPGFTGGVSIAVGDVDGDTVPDIVVGAGPGGGAHVKIFRVDAQAGTVTELGSFFPYDPGFTGGVQVAVSDVDGTGPAEIVTGTGAGGGPHVRMWKVGPGGAVTELGSPGFFALPPGFLGGVSVAGGLFR